MKCLILFTVLFVFMESSFAFSYKWKQTSKTDGICYLQGLDQNLRVYENVAKVENCFSTHNYKWIKKTKLEGQCLRIQKKQIAKVFYTNCETKFKTIANWEIINSIGFCFIIDKKTFGQNFKRATSDLSACYPKLKTYVINTDLNGVGLCYMVDKKQASNFKLQVPFIHCMKKIKSAGRAPAIKQYDNIEDSSRLLQKDFKWYERVQINIKSLFK